MTRGGRRRGILAGVLALLAGAAVVLGVGLGVADPGTSVDRTAARTAPTTGHPSSRASGDPAAEATALRPTPAATRAAAAEATDSEGASTTEAATTTASDQTTSELPLAGRTIVVDPGHDGGNATHPSTVNRPVRIGNGSKACDTTGTESVRGQSEHAYTWSVARQVRLALQADGATVILTRRDDRGVGPCITRRMPRANAARADLAISIHGDGGPAGGRGFHVILPGEVPSIARHDRIVAPSARLGRAVRAAFRTGTGMPYSTYLGTRGLDVRTDLGGLNLIRVPGVMIETGNMRNATDARLMADGSWRRRAGRAIAAGITTWLLGESR